MRMPALEFFEQEQRAQQWTIKRNGSVVSLSGKTVTISARDKDKTAGTLRISGASVTVTDAPNGVCAYIFTTADLTITESAEKGTHIDGQYQLKISGGGETWKSYLGDFKILQDPMIAAT